jgi:hypothetical protein
MLSSMPKNPVILNEAFPDERSESRRTQPGRIPDAPKAQSSTQIDCQKDTTTRGSLY